MADTPIYAKLGGSPADPTQHVTELNIVDADGNPASPTVTPAAAVAKLASDADLAAAVAAFNKLIDSLTASGLMAAAGK